MNKDRRDKFKQWFNKALLPVMSKRGKIRVVGTILHMDSLLEGVMPYDRARDTVHEPLRSYSTNDKATWKAVRYRAHSEDFKHILWPTQFSKERLLDIRKIFTDQGMYDGYCQEYLNHPIDESKAFFKKADLLPMSQTPRHKRYYVGVDLAISKMERSNYTAMVVGGMDSESILDIEYVSRGRWDAKEIIDELFYIQKKFEPEIITIEKGQIERSILPFLRDEMFRRGIFLNLNIVSATKDKRARARSIQGRLTSGGVRFDMDAEWYPDFEFELLKFDRGAYDDQVDAFAWLGLTIDKFIEGPTEEEHEEEEYDEFFAEHEDAGRNSHTGY